MIANPKLIEILLVEDNPGDIELAREAFREAKTANNIHSVRDGEEALEFLYMRGRHTTAVRPDLMLLDMNMPRKSGMEVLEIIKIDDSLKNIPVIVLTSSEAEQDILKSYQLHANAYIVKPADLAEFMHVVELIDSFWLGLAVLPPRNRKVG